MTRGEINENKRNGEEERMREEERQERIMLKMLYLENEDAKLSSKRK